VLRAIKRRGLLATEDVQVLAAGEHGEGFRFRPLRLTPMKPALASIEASSSLDASVRIEPGDRRGLERLLRYCARPAFALERLREIDAEHLVY
jgi:hypothetical protein